ncbi:MAG: signal peptidase II [Phycisphaerales bacterium]|nr:signal peptidase II [Phycisphaerales bacterium]
MPDPPVTDSASHPRALRAPSAIARFLIVIALLLAADLVSKHVAFERVADAPVRLAETPGSPAELIVPAHATRIVVPRILGLHLTLNRGAVFGLGQGGRWVFVVFSLIAAVAIAIAFARSSPTAAWYHIALAAVLAGALGNLYDRLQFGVVRDLLLLFPGVSLPFGWSWPDGSRGLYPWIFNIADVCLVVGLLALLLIMHRHDRRLARERAAA